MPSNRRQHALLFGLAIMAFVLFLTLDYYRTNRAYAVYVEGELLGLVAEKAAIEAELESAVIRATLATRRVVSVSQSVEIVEMRGLKRLVTAPVPQVRKKLREHLTLVARGVSIVVNGRPLVVVAGEETANRLVDRLVGQYREEVERAIGREKNGVKEVRFEEVAVADRLEMRPGTFRAPEIADEEQAWQVLTGGTDRALVHTVKKGESLWAIAAAHRLTVDELQRANPHLRNPDLVRPGEEINLVVTEPVVNLRSREVVTYAERIPFRTQVVYDGTLWPWQRVVRQGGEPGERVVTVASERMNGRVTAEKVISEKVTREPKPQVIAQGTRTLPSRAAGRFLWPLQGPITSGFGTRWGQFHGGVDIAAPLGTEVRAAAGGTVASAGWQGGYGLAVVVDHGGGLTTLYGHNSALLVKPGDRVEQGQVISRVGNTGRSSGPHLHFEVRVNDEPLDPVKFYQQQAR